MITEEMFLRQFEKISASFNRAISAKNLDIWYEEVESREPEIFLRACYELRYADKFPSFVNFRVAYNSAKESIEAGQPIVRSGCRMCHGGQVLWEKGDYSYAGRCGNCRGEREHDKHTVDPVAIKNDAELVLLLPTQDDDKVVPREAVRELYQFIAEVDSVRESRSDDEIVRSKNLARDRARDTINQCMETQCYE